MSRSDKGKGAQPGGGQGGGSGGSGGGAGAGGDRGGSQPKYSPGDDRSIVKNPTSPAHGDDKINRDKQRGGSGGS